MDRAIKLALDLDETLSKSRLGAFLNYPSAGRWVDSGTPRSSAMGTPSTASSSKGLLSDRQDSSRQRPRQEDVALALESLLTPRNSGPAKPCPPPASPRHVERSVLNLLHGAAEEVIGGAAAICRSNVSSAYQTSDDRSRDPSQWTEEQLRAYLRHAPGSGRATSVQTREQLVRRACRVMHGATPSSKTSGAKAVPNVGKENADTRHALQASRAQAACAVERVRCFPPRPPHPPSLNSTFDLQDDACQAIDADDMALFKAIAAPASGLRPRHTRSPPRPAVARREGADEMLWPELFSSGPPATTAAAGGGGSDRRSRNHSSHNRPLQPAAPAAAASTTTTTTTTTQTERRSDHCRRHHRCPQQARAHSARQTPEALVPLLSLEEQLGIQLTPRPPHRSFEEPPGLPPSSQRAKTPPASSSRKATGTGTSVKAAVPEESRARVEAWARGKDFRAMVATLEEVGRPV